ncbi:MAG: aminotransferase class I/II-fold pyridoxal phosphate-dependent enzyme, partial [Pseudomonadota bacterium]|nr:aminotransferase class I/II-fold pyridoxal phosphate-dependent enzyme [Pseudomonadota bacterium]
KSYKIAKLLQLAKNLELLIIDEAFCDCTPDQSIIPHLQTYNILVLRSLGKFFGLAGLRLGFVIGTIENIEPIKTRLGPWAVSGPAIEIGQRALSDVAWITQMHERLDLHSNRLNQVLLQKHLHIIGSTKLFKLVENKYASEIYRILCESGILVRQFEENKDWLRIGLPGPENEWRRLDAALDLCLNTVNNMSK